MNEDVYIVRTSVWLWQYVNNKFDRCTCVTHRYGSQHWHTAVQSTLLTIAGVSVAVSKRHSTEICGVTQRHSVIITIILYYAPDGEWRYCAWLFSGHCGHFFFYWRWFPL